MSHTVFLLSAGFGTRLRPLTNHRPKPLLPLLGRPMIDYSLEWLKKHGHTSFIVNAHHLWKHVAEWAEQNNVELQVELPDILGTGGGLKVANNKLASRFLIWNGDIISNIDVSQLLNSCPEDGASMALRYTTNLGKTTPLAVDQNGRVIRIGNICATSDAPELQNPKDGLHFSGIHAMSKAAISMIPDGFQCVVRTAYKELVPQRRVNSIIHKGDWYDTGLPGEYLEANLKALRGEFPLEIDVWKEANSTFNDSWVHKDAEVSGVLQESIIGSGAHIPTNSTLQHCIVWDNVIVPSGNYHRCIFHDGGILPVEPSSE
jgi:mannose-1-phosphate guanylyltransferase